MDEYFAIMIANISSTALFCGFVTFWVWMDQRKKVRLRTIEQEERLRHLESGFPYDEPALARAKADAERAKAMGAIGIVASISLSTALLLTSFATVHYAAAAPAIFIVPWAVGCPVILGSVAICIGSLRPSRFSSAPATEAPASPRPASTGFTAGRPGEGVSPHA